MSVSKPEDAAEAEKERKSLCYKRNEISFKSLNYARSIQAAFVNNYLSKVNNVQLTE